MRMVLLVGGTLLVLWAARPTWGQVTALNAWTLGGSTAPAGTSFSVTVNNVSVSAGTNRVFVVAAILEAGSAGTVSGFNATLGGTSLTPIATTETTSARMTVKTWYLLNASIPGGAANLIVSGTHQQTPSGVQVFWGSYSGVDQTTPINSRHASYSGNTNVTFNAVITYPANGLTFYAAGNGGSPATMTPPAAFTQRASSTLVGESGFLADTGTQATAGSFAATTSVSFGGTTASRSVIAVASLNPAATNGTAAGAVTAVSTAGSCNSITVTAPYTNDSNANNSLSYRYRTPTGTGAWVGPTTRPHSPSPYSFAISPLTFGATYDVEVTYVDADGVTGTAVQTVSNILVGHNCTGAGTATAAQTTGATPSILITAPYTNDANANNTASYRYRTPTGTGAWVGPTSLPHAASPYTATISGLTCRSSYDVEVTYADADGIGSGTAVQTISNIVLNNCINPAAPTGTANSCSQVTVSAPFTNNANANGTTAFARGTAAGGPFTAVTGCTAVTGASPRQCVDTTVAASTTYYYQVTVSDPDGITGTNPQVTAAIATPACNQPIVTPGAPTATVNSCTQITVNAPFTGDTNTNSTTKVEYNTTNTWPGTTPASCTALTGASPRACAVSGLTNTTAYYFRVTFTDADGVSGTNPQVIGPFTTQDCRVAPAVPSATANSCSQVTVSASFSGDANGNSTTTFNRSPSSTGPWTGVNGCSGLAGVSPRTCVDTTVTATTTYYYQVVFADADGVNGQAAQVTTAVTTPACTPSNTAAGTVTALASGCAQITVSAPFTGDGNANGSAAVEYNTANTWPGTAACTAVGPSPRTCNVTNLAASTAYYIRATYADADGVTGTNPQVVGPITTPACTGNGAPPMIMFLVPAKGAVVGGTEKFKVQVYAPNILTAANTLWSIDGGATTTFTAASAAPGYACGTNCAVYEFSVNTAPMANGSHYATVKATDNSGNVAQVSRSFVVQNTAGGLALGAGNLLRRSHAPQLCLDCHSIATHSSQTTSFKYGSWAQDCLVCHTPHATPNVYLIRPSLETPNSGTKSVSFRDAATGVGANSLATPTASGNGVNICEVCHTKTKNGDGSARARNNAATDWTKHYTTSCIACHPHGKGFAASESDGGFTCSGCHASIWSRMQAAGGSAYKHTLAVDTFNDDAVVWGVPLNANAAAARSCVNMCHDDHPHTATDDPSPALHYNLAYVDATSTASRAATTRTVATKAKTDFDNTLAAGGLCMSCHRNAVETGTTPAHPALSQASYAASAHNTTSTTPGGAWQYTLHDTSSFTRNCTKCHWDAADGTTPTVSGMGIGAVHGNANPSLLMGTTNPAGAPAGSICYRCHGGGTTGADYSSRAVYQDGVKTYKHPFDADAVHVTTAELYNAAWGNTLGVTGRHSNCQDCHEPHVAQKSIKQGTITASSTTTMTDSTMNGRWAASQWVGSLLYVPTLGAGQNARAITGSTAAGVLTVAAWTTAPAVGSTYYILDNKADGGLAGAWGAQLSSNPTLWTAPTSANFTKKTIVAGSDLQATLCFKCHSSFYWGAGTPPNGLSANGTVTTPVETDVAMEFNPSNRSGHPVLASLNNYAGSTAPKALAAAQMVAPWNVAVGAQTMSCSDCHTTDAAAPAALGPHGSAVAFMIKNGAAKPGWPTALASAAGFATTFCSDCHANANIHTRDGAHSSSSCYRCHIVIPHGGKMSRLIGDNNGTMPARYAYGNSLANLNIQSFTKASSDANYQEANCQSGTNGCTNHSTAASENW